MFRDASAFNSSFKAKARLGEHVWSPACGWKKHLLRKKLPTGSGAGSRPGVLTEPRLLPNDKAGGDCADLRFPIGSSHKLLHLPRRMQGIEPRVQSNPAQQWESGEKYRPIVMGPWYIIQHPVLCTLGPPIPSPCSVPHSFEGMAGISPWAGTALLTLVLSLIAERRKSLGDHHPPLSRSAWLFPRLTPADQHRPFWA